MDIEQVKQQCLERLRTLYPEPWFEFWGIGAGVHCDEAIAYVRPHGHDTCHSPVSHSLPLPELLKELMAVDEVDSEASARQGGNYVTDDPAFPKIVWFANGRVVRLQGGNTPHLGVGTDFQQRDNVFEL